MRSERSVPLTIDDLWRAAAARGGWYSQYRCSVPGCDRPGFRWRMGRHCMLHGWELDRLMRLQARDWARTRHPVDLRYYWNTRKGYHGF